MTTATRSGVVPRIHADGISWRLVGGFLEVRIDLVNKSSEPTEDAQLVIETAPLGAFVPFKPGTRVAVAGLDPWERRRVTAMIPAATLEELLECSPDMRTFRAVNKLLRDVGHWAGNLNVYFDYAPEQGVELHRALGLKLEAGVKTGIVFAMDASQSYTMEAKSSDPGWEAEVRALVPGVGSLVVTAPAQVDSRATIEVLVTRLLDGKTVPVVFGMETVASEGETLGCIRV